MMRQPSWVFELPDADSLPPSARCPPPPPCSARPLPRDGCSTKWVGAAERPPSASGTHQLLFFLIFYPLSFSALLPFQYLFVRLSAGHGIQRWVRAAYAKVSFSHRFSFCSWSDLYLMCPPTNQSAFNIKLRLYFLCLPVSCSIKCACSDQLSPLQFLLPATPPWSSGRSCMPFKQVLRFELAGE